MPITNRRGRLAVEDQDGVQLADSDSVIELEGNVYFPPESLDRRYLKKTRMRTLCPWKGVARYYTIEASGVQNPHAAASRC